MSADAPRALSLQLLHDRRAVALSTTARDPRAAPGDVRGNTSIPVTCEFYGFADAISLCRVPRSCQDCLATPGCGITTYGECRNITSYPGFFDNSHDYRSATFSNNSLMSNSNVYNTSAFVFLAGTTTYCQASDLVCTQCRQDFQEIANKSSTLSPNYVGTQFCKGDDGCVCINICEVPEERATRVRDTECGRPYRWTTPLPIISRAYKQTSARSDPRAPAVKVEHTSKKEETCAYTKEIDLRGCRRPRSCQECLLKPGCMIGDATCTDMTRYEWSRDFRTAQLNASQRSYARGRLFPSSNTTYCDATDAACAACRKSFPSRTGFDWYTLVFNADFCVGQDGCVCIEACESEVWSHAVYDEEYNQSEVRGGTFHPGLSLLGIFGTVLFLSLVYKCCKAPRDTPQRRGQTESGAGGDGRRLWRHMLDEVPALPVLDLFGWRAHQDELLVREQALLRGVEVAPVRRPVDFDNMDPSAPDFDEDDASAPTAQDPKALASAPAYRSSFHDDSSRSSATHDTDHSSPSAPDFDMEEMPWEASLTVSQSERVGLVTRRSRREDGDSHDSHRSL